MFFPSLVLFLAILLLRLGLANYWNLGASAQWASGMPMGIYFDCVALFLPFIFSRVTRGLFRNAYLGWALGAVLIWGAAAANLMNVRFFGEPLDWLSVSMQFRNVFAIRGSVAGVLSWEFFLSAALFGTALFLAGLRYRKSSIRRAWSHGAAALGLLVAFLCARQVITAFALDRYFSTNLLGRWVLKDWYDGYRTNLLTLDRCLLSKEAAQPSIDLLAAYAKRGSSSSPVPSTAALRARLGFAPQGDLNIIVLLVESLRGYEFFHPLYAQAVFPETHALFKHHGLLFPQTYATAKLTVNGEFGALCSSLPPSYTGAGIYDVRARLPVRCIQGLVAAKGYETFYVNSYHCEFSGTKTWERHHGTRTFLDYGFFSRVGITEKIGQWGLADRPFLLKALNEMESVHARGKPFLANILTMSSHGPFSEVPGFPLGAELQKSAKNAEHRGMLSTYRYLDSALGSFFKAFLASPLAENTLIVFSSDHSLGSPAIETVGSVVDNEVRGRIVLGLFAKGLKNPGRSLVPANQLDVAPTVSAVLGLESPPEWLGHNLLHEGNSTPWVFVGPWGVGFRARDRACYSGPQGAECYRLKPDQDPLFHKGLPLFPKAKEDLGFFQSLVEANDRLIKNGCAANNP